MSIKYSTNGNLALKVYSKQSGPQLRVIDCTGSQEPVHRQIIDQVFADPAHGFTAKPVAAALSNMQGNELCSSIQDKAFIALTGAVASFVLFYFSFFAF